MRKSALIGVLSLGGMMLFAASGEVVRAADAVPSPSVSAQPAATPVHAKKTKKSISAKKKSVKAVKEVWVCPMGEYKGDKPGVCPTCGMDLVKVETAK